MTTTKQKLTGRQQAVVDGLAANQAPAEIAKTMGISVNGVYGHIRRLKATGVLPDTGTAGRKRSRRSTNGKVPQSATRLITAIEQAKAQGAARIQAIEDEIKVLTEEAKAIREVIG